MQNSVNSSLLERSELYKKTQISFSYNSNRIEGSKLSYGDVCNLFDVAVMDSDDQIEAVNHFRCFDLIIDNVEVELSEIFIKKLHKTLEDGTSKATEEWFSVGEYKLLENIVGGVETALPNEVHSEMESLIAEYNSNEEKTLEDILDFHVRFERIHPFQDGNGRVGRLVMFKECLKSNIVPFIIEDRLKMFYYRGLKEWNQSKGYLQDTCLTCQDVFKNYLDYFCIKY